MGNPLWFRKQLNGFLRPGDQLLELGAGEGLMGRKLFPQMEAREVTWTGLDCWSRPRDWPEPWEWFTADLTQFKDFSPYPGILGNLILHQFPDEILAELGRHWNETARFLLFSEPQRHPVNLLLLKATPLLGMHRITLHDGAVSIRAGFRGNELAEILQLDPRRWKCEVFTTWTGSYRLRAWRTDLI